MDMTIKELKKFIQYQLDTKRVHYYSVLKKQHSVECEHILSATSFLSKDAKLLSRYYCIMNDILEHPTCFTCYKPTKWKRLYVEGFQNYCNANCKNNDQRQQTICKQGMLKKHGVINASQIPGVYAKKQKTWMKKYGVDHPTKSYDIKEKTKQTNIERYGVEHAMKLSTYQDKAKKTNIERYGIEYIQQHKKFRDKSRNTSLRKYNRQTHSQRHIPIDILNKLNDYNWMHNQHVVQQKSLSRISKNIGICDTTVGRYLHSHHINTKYFFQSTGEKEVGDFFISLDVPIDYNNRSVIPPYEIDMYIPSHKLAIEYCGLYWHSEQQGKDKNYHKRKHDLCKEQGIQLLTIFEDEWIYQTDCVKRKLCQLVGKNNTKPIYARKTKVAGVNSNQKKEFFDKYHIQGNGPGSINIGLIYNKSLVACMSFIKQQKGTYYLNRYATSLSVVGGFSKLLKHFQSTYDWIRLVSFADQRWSNGDLYEKTGWVCDGVIPADYCYIERDKRIHKFNYRRKNLPNLLKSFDPSLSEWENCKANKILRIWDCGKIKYVTYNRR